MNPMRHNVHDGNRSVRGRLGFAALTVAGMLLVSGCADGIGPSGGQTAGRSPIMFITPLPDDYIPTEYIPATPNVVTVPPTEAAVTDPPGAEVTDGGAVATETPDGRPTEVPAEAPTEPPTEMPTEMRTEATTEPPTEAPTEIPADPPTQSPSEKPDVTERPWDPSVYAAEEDDLPYARYYIEVSLKGQLVYIYSTDANGEKDELVKTMICSSGREGKTPQRTWIVLSNDTQGKEITDTGFVSHYEFEWVKGCTAQYITRLWKADWDENGKLKVTDSSYLFHSTPFDSIDKDTLRSEDWNKLGTPVSDGCIRLCVRDAHWIFTRVAPYSIVRTVEGSEDPELWAKLKLPDIPAGTRHDPTDVY